MLDEAEARKWLEVLVQRQRRALQTAFNNHDDRSDGVAAGLRIGYEAVEAIINGVKREE